MAEIDNQTPHCSGNCMKCSPFQRAYCSSQLAYSNMRMLEQVEKQMMTMQGEMTFMKEKIEAMQNNETHLIYPTSEAEKESATREAAQTVGSQNSLTP